MEADTAASTSDVFSWTWGNAKLGTLATVVHRDGTIRQRRRHPRDAAPSDNQWGRIPVESARRLIEQARAACGATAIPTSAEAPFPPTTESLEVRVTSASGDFVRIVPVAELSRHPDLAELRRSVVSLRRQISGRFF